MDIIFKDKLQESSMKIMSFIILMCHLQQFLSANKQK